MKTIDKIMLWTGIAIAPFVAILNGLVFSKLWAWFVVPQFGVKPISLLLAIGLSMTIGFLVAHDEAKTRKYSDDEKLFLLISAILSAFIRPLITLAMAYVVHILM